MGALRRFFGTCLFRMAMRLLHDHDEIVVDVDETPEPYDPPRRTDLFPHAPGSAPTTAATPSAKARAMEAPRSRDPVPAETEEPLRGSREWRARERARHAKDQENDR